MTVLHNQQHASTKTLSFLHFPSSLPITAKFQPQLLNALQLPLVYIPALLLISFLFWDPLCSIRLVDPSPPAWLHVTYSLCMPNSCLCLMYHLSWVTSFHICALCQTKTLPLTLMERDIENAAVENIYI